MTAKGDINEAEPLEDDLEEWDVEVVPAHELEAPLLEPRRLIGALLELGVALPVHHDLRVTLAGEEGNASNPTTGTAGIDFDIGGTVLPIGVEAKTPGLRWIGSRR